MYANSRTYSIDWGNVIARLLKYSAEGVVLALACYSIPGGKLDVHEIVTIALVAAATMSVLDIASPSIGSSARMGSGLVIGANLAGGLHQGGPKVLR